MGDHVVKEEKWSFSKPRIIAVCGVKNSGKTTFLETLVRTLAKRGFRTAVIKHDGHDFSCDIPGTDSHRLQQAGAYGTAVFSDRRIFVHKMREEADADSEERASRGERENERTVRELMAYFPEADFIFVEGLKDSTLPKIELIRREVSDRPASNRQGRFLLVTDWNKDKFHEPVADFSEVERVIELIMKKG